MPHLRTQIDACVLPGVHIELMFKRLTTMRDRGTHAAPELAQRTRTQTVDARRLHQSHFQAVRSALLRRQRLAIAYHARSKDESTAREISPQRLIQYRDNCYLDPWCHLRKALRIFSVDEIRHFKVLDRKAIEVLNGELVDEVLGAGGAHTRPGAASSRGPG